ncbi:MAG: hypothetical protein BAJATHORv1_70047 [Candidatus Thorarchaeota archaeon]|nr:MAG: hypothetical protein BAJATHORv1_70047 [Candidatus Thorarchaeota archaeon]
MDIEGVIIFDAKSGIPMFSKLKEGIDPSMFSSFISAVDHFSSEFQMGGLTSFATEENLIFLSKKGRIITALIVPKTQEFRETDELAAVLTEQFEKRYEIPERPQPLSYEGFRGFVDETLRRMKYPFLSKVSIFVHNQYGGEISIKPRLMKRNGEEGVIDMIATSPIKRDDDEELHHELALSENFTFVKAIDGIATRGDVMEFIDSIHTYGAKILRRGKTEFIPYFPQRAVIVAREFSSTVEKYLTRLPEDNGQLYVDGSKLFGRFKNITREVRCGIELWEWKNGGNPQPVKPKENYVDVT